MQDHITLIIQNSANLEAVKTAVSAALDGVGYENVGGSWDKNVQRLEFEPKASV